jgi:hypothetical protein
MRTQAAHDTYGFKVSGLGNHEQRDGRWFVLPLWKGFEDKTSEHVWQDLDDVLAGIPVVVKRYLNKLLKSKDAAMAKAGREMRCAGSSGSSPSSSQAASWPSEGAKRAPWAMSRLGRPPIIMTGDMCCMA